MKHPIWTKSISVYQGRKADLGPSPQSPQSQSLFMHFLKLYSKSGIRTGNWDNKTQLVDCTTNESFQNHQSKLTADVSHNEEKQERKKNQNWKDSTSLRVKIYNVENLKFKLYNNLSFKF